MKHNILGLFVFVIAFITLFSFPTDSNANKALGEIRDGNATGSKYSPTDVHSSVKRAWERKQITRGGKASSHRPSNGKRLVYDIYDKNWNLRNNTLTFEGWSAKISYVHHDRYNQATYIGADRVQGNKEKADANKH